jgi:hypothetical protein
VQYSGYDVGKKKVVGHPGAEVKHISGRNWLSNEGVNAAAAALTSLAAGVIAVKWPLLGGTIAH